MHGFATVKALLTLLPTVGGDAFMGAIDWAMALVGYIKNAILIVKKTKFETDGSTAYIPRIKPFRISAPRRAIPFKESMNCKKGKNHSVFSAPC